MHLSPKSLLELFSPRRVAGMAALAMRPRLPLPLRRLLRAAASCACRRLLLPDAPCRRIPMPPLAATAAACCCVMRAVAACRTGAAAC